MAGMAVAAVAAGQRKAFFHEAKAETRASKSPIFNSRINKSPRLARSVRTHIIHVAEDEWKQKLDIPDDSSGVSGVSVVSRLASYPCVYP